jgi:predicted N-acetyltransferase YhbS
MARQSQALDSREQSLLIRKSIPADAEVCGKICFEAFRTVANQHNFPQDFPSAEVSTGLLSMMFSNPGFFCVVAEQGGKIIGSNCLDERTPIAGVGPITVDPAVQNRAAGRQLMQAVMTRAAERKFAGIRLVQSAYHNRSLSLYATFFTGYRGIRLANGDAAQQKRLEFHFALAVICPEFLANDALAYATVLPSSIQHLESLSSKAAPCVVALARYCAQRKGVPEESASRRPMRPPT